MRRLLFLLALLPSFAAQADIVSVAPVVVTGITAGNEITLYQEGPDFNADANYAYTDLTSFIADGSLPPGFENYQLIHTKHADRGSTTTDVVQFTPDTRTYYCVAHDDSITSKPAWLTSAPYNNSGWDITVGGESWEAVMSLYCADGSIGEISLDGNTTDGDTNNAMYLVLVGHAMFVAPNAAPAGAVGNYQFITSGSSINAEATTVTANVERINGSNGATSVDITDLGTGSCVDGGTDYNTLTDETISWADTASGDGGGISIVAQTITGPCTIDLAFTNAVGGITSSGAQQTHTVTITDPQVLKAFPDCEGFGCETTHGRGGTVVRVTNTNDSGAGSLREALLTTEPRIIVFTVSGTIQLQSPIRLGSNESYVYVAGQTAPGDGIALEGPDEFPALEFSRDLLSFENGNNFHDGVIQHIRFRHGAVGPEQSQNDCIGIYTGTNKLVLDHNSFTWSGDELIGVWVSTPSGVAGAIHDITLSRSILAEPANQGHALGPLLSGAWRVGSSIYNVTFHHNLSLHAQARDYNLDSGSQGADRGVQFINNIHYNWRGSHYGFGQNRYSGDSATVVDVINDLFIDGPDSGATVRPARINRCPEGSSWGCRPTDTDYYPVSLYFVGSRYELQNGDAHSINDEVENDNMMSLQFGGETWTDRVVPLTDQPTHPVTVQSYADAYTSVVTNEDVGATKPAQDSVDQRLVDDPVDGSGFSLTLVPPPHGSGSRETYTTSGVPTDTDADGVPDAYETSPLGTNPSVFENQAILDHDADGFSNIEEWIHSL